MRDISPTVIRIREQLDRIPDEVFDHRETLELLDLSNNRLSDLPAELSECSRLRILFLSNNQFSYIPEVLAACPSLDTIAFKSNQISELEPHHLPERLRWLMVTNNRISTLHASFGRFSKLRKLAFAGNALESIPEEIGGCQSLELVRFSSNRLKRPPVELFDLPNLAWMSFSGNAYPGGSPDRAIDRLPLIGAASVTRVKQISAGASGTLSLARLQGGQSTRDVALKEFSGDITSDGNALDEVELHARCLGHSNIIELLGRTRSTRGDQGLLMELVPPSYEPLGLPPSLETCTRDTFLEASKFSSAQIASVGIQVAGALEHLLSNHVSHGDLYAHNILASATGHLYVCDFGAASDLSVLSSEERVRVEHIETCAFGRLLEDMIRQSSRTGVDTDSRIGELAAVCTHSDVAARPRLSQVKAEIEKLMGEFTA